MMVVVPTLSPHEIAKQRIITAVIVRRKISIAPEMTEGVDAAARMPKNASGKKVSIHQGERIDHYQYASIDELHRPIMPMQSAMQRRAQDIRHKSNPGPMEHG